jgi:pyridoxine 5-phosphate synthase
MTRLSVNLNKIALLRNQREVGIPGVTWAAREVIAAGAHGITVHPRPDGRHIRPADVHELAALLKDHPGVEFNIEGNPFPEFMEMVRQVRPHQCTLVPDMPSAVTSDHGWELSQSSARLAPVIAELRKLGCRVSLFMEATSEEWQQAREIGADRVELYTEPYARAAADGDAAAMLNTFGAAARSAQQAGLGVNAGHDLNLQNLSAFVRIPGILEVSIGHALIADALKLGLGQAVRAYLEILAD